MTSFCLLKGTGFAIVAQSTAAFFQEWKIVCSFLA